MQQSGNRRNIVLTGFMGTGKTTVGRALAKQLDWTFVDTDALIEAEQGRTISRIFSEDGESAFREMEATIAARLAQGDAQVIATGGRMMLDPRNVASLGAHAEVICLTAAPETILARIHTDGDTRPLLQGDDPAAKIARLLAERQAAYGQFRQINTDDRSLTAVVTDMINLLFSE